MSSYTPGPWLQDWECCIPSGTHPASTEPFEGFEVKDGDGWPIAFIPVRFPTHPVDKWPAKRELDWDEATKNLRLISAAPELLEALETMLVEFNEQMAGVVHDELAVIAKARAAIAKATGEKE